MTTPISRLEGSPPPRRRSTPLDTRPGVDSHNTTHPQEDRGVRTSVPSRMGRSPFSSVSSMSLDTSSSNAPAFGNFDSALTSDYGDHSPSCRSLPPQRGRSVSGGSTVMVNPRISQSLPREGGSQPQALGSTMQTAPTGNNPTGTDESSVEPTIRFDRLAGVIPDNVITEIRNLVSHQGLQRRKLATAASNLNTLRSQAHELRTNAESLTRRIDRVLTDTVNVISEGDEIISSMSRTLDPPITRIPSSMDGPAPTRPEVRPSSPNIDDHRISMPIDRPSITQQDRTPSDQQSEGSFDPPEELPPQSSVHTYVQTLMNRELPPRGPFETDDQYDQRYQAQLRRISNTHRSWARGVGYDPPPHLPSFMPSRTTDGTPGGDRGWVNSHPNRPDQPSQTRDEAGDNPQPRVERVSREQQVQFDSASRIYHYDHNNNGNSQAGDQSHGGPLGLSAYRVSRAPPNNGLWNSEQYHYTVLLKRIRKLIEWKVGRTMAAPAGSKQPKMGEPSKYLGNRNHDVFLQWLNQFLNWLRSHYHCRDNADFSRVNFLGSYLDGVAADWFAVDVDNPDKVMDAPITFIDAICAMHRQFVHPAMANNTATQYDKVEYTPSTGVEGFYYALDKLASRMVERPSDYSFRLRMFEGLPTWIYDTLLERNILPKFCTLEDIRENARQIEEISLHTWNTFKGSSATGNNSCSTANRNTTSRNNNIPRNVSITTSRNNPLCIDTKKKSSIRNNGDTRAAAGASNSHPSQRSNNNNNNSTHKTGGARDASASHHRTSDITCYKCGGKGHISSDPSCPQYGKPNTNPRFNAQR